MRLPENLLSPGTYVKPRLFLCETDKTRLCQLDVTDLNGSFKFIKLKNNSFKRLPQILRHVTSIIINNR